MHERYNGYKAYDYLGNYRSLPLSCGDQRVPECLIPLTPEQEEREQEMRKKNILIGLHDHIDLLPEDVFKDMGAYMRSGRRCIGYAQMARGNYDAVIEGLGGPLSKVASPMGAKWDDCIYDIGMRSCDVAHQDLLVKCLTVNDIYKAKENGQIAWIMGMEDASCIENELDRLDILYGFGLRCIGVTYASCNTLGCGGEDRYDFGLTEFGEKAVERMNKLGFLIDCAHSSDKTIIETAQVSTAPIILSHIGARSLWNTKRMASDESIRAVAEKGGIIGIECAPHTTMTGMKDPHTFESVIRHFEYVRDLVGIDHVMFGADSLYGDHVALHQSSRSDFNADPEDGAVSVPYVRGAENPTEVSKNIVRYLVSANYSDEEIAKVMGGNLLRVLEQAWK